MTNGVSTAGRVPAIRGTHLCVLHGEDGTILHMHRVTTFAGAQSRADAEIEREARSLAGRRRRLTITMRALHLRDFELDPAKTYKVDIRAGRLVADGELSVLVDRIGGRGRP